MKTFNTKSTIRYNILVSCFKALSWINRYFLLLSYLNVLAKTWLRLVNDSDILILSNYKKIEFRSETQFSFFRKLSRFFCNVTDTKTCQNKCYFLETALRIRVICLTCLLWALIYLLPAYLMTKPVKYGWHLSRALKYSVTMENKHTSPWQFC